MYLRNWEDFFQFDDNGRIIQPESKFNHELGANVAANSSATIDNYSATVLPGSLSGELGDKIAVELTAGQTYSFSYRSAPTNGIRDPYLALYGLDGTTLIQADDDGGFGTGSMVGFTPTVTGTYYVYATSWYHVDATAPGYPDARDTGDYTLHMWTKDATQDAGATIATSQALQVGTNYGYIDAAGDVDVYSFQVEAGSYYSFNYSGGVSGAGDVPGNVTEQGENYARLTLLDANGNTFSPTISNLNYESGVGYFAKNSGTVYVRVSPGLGTGGYTLDATKVDLSTRDPVEAFNWDRAANVPFVDTDGDGVGDTAYVYFGKAGENFGQADPANPAVPMQTFGWQQFQIDGVMDALKVYEDLLGVKYVITDDASKATFRLATTENQVFGARFYPQEPAYGDLQGVGTFNLLSGRFNEPDSLKAGGFSYAVILHEFGHAHGIAHPHDTGGGSEIMLGVTGATGSLGVFDLNQGVYSVMSYNDGYQTHPDGLRAYSGNLATGTFRSGWSATLGAFDIAVLQERYGVKPGNVGDTVYTLADTQAAAKYQTIWDSDGVDTIAYDGTKNAQIDLLAATLDYTPTGGGVVSYVSNIWGGYTIANGAVIENATGGSGNDTLLGNASANVLTGNAGNDALLGRAGNDSLLGGAGNDNLNGNEGDDSLDGGDNDDSLKGEAGNDSLNGGAGNDNLEGGAGNDVLSGGEGDDAINGGEDRDRVSYLAAAAAISLSLASGTATGEGTDTLLGIEDVDGSTFGDSIEGNGGANSLNGLGGNDVLSGGGGDDVVDGGEGGDTLSGGLGNDLLIGGNGVDTASYADSATAVVASLVSNQVTGEGTDTLSGIENLTGSALADRLTGNAGDNAINGGGGDDLLAGGAGNDAIDGGTGVDTVTYASATAAVTVNLGAGTASGQGNDTLVNVENVIGSAFADRITGDGVANRLEGQGGADIILGGGGNDVVLGGTGIDVVTLGTGDDLFVAETGGAKVLLKSGSMTVDIITDFDANGAGNDKIDVSGFANDFIFRGTNANKGIGDLTYKTYDSITGAENALGFDIDGQAGAGGVKGPVTIVYGNVDGGAADFGIILLNTSSVDASDFVF